MEFAKYLKSSFITEHLQTTASGTPHYIAKDVFDSAQMILL